MALPTYSTALAYFAPVTEMARALDVLNAIPVLPVEERLAAAVLLEHFSTEHLEEGSPERTAASVFAASLDLSRADYDHASWENLRRLWSDASPPISGVYPSGLFSKKPHFRVGPVDVYQSDILTGLWRPNKRPDLLHGEGGYGRLLSNEPNFSLFYPSVAGLGGVVFGVGTFQNLNLVVASEASGLILADLSPMVAVSMALLLAQIPKQSRHGFAETVLNLFRKEEPTEPFLEDVDCDYRPVVSFVIEQIRAQPHLRDLRRYLKRALQDPSEALGKDTYYDFLANCIRAGAAAVIHGNLFAADMPDLVAAAMSVHNEPLRTIYLSNAPEWMRKEKAGAAASLSGLFDTAFTDQRGVLLASTEYGRSEKARSGKAALGDQFSYHALPIATASLLLKAYGRVTRFVGRLQTERGLNDRPQI